MSSSIKSGEKNLFKPDIFDSVEGEILFSEGQRARHLYILLRGCVKLYKTEDGVPVQVTDIEPGGIFGVMFLFFSNRLTLTQAVCGEALKDIPAEPSRSGINLK